MPEPFSQNLAYLVPSATIALSREAKRRKAAGEDVIDLGVGEPDFDTPQPAAQAGIQAIQRGETRYPPNAGIAPLREAIAANLSRLSGGRPVDPNRVLVSTGSKQALFNACFALFGPKDRVLIPTPAWVSYPQIVRLARAEPVAVPGDPEWGLKVGVADLNRKTDKLVRGLILCSPNNPTGGVYTLGELRSMAAWAAEHRVWIVADEIYRRIYFGPGAAPSFLDLPDELLERVVVITGASKAYAMTGWRIGAAYGPAALIGQMDALQSHTTTGANHPAQYAAAAAFGDERVEQEVLRMRDAFHRRRDLVADRFRREFPGVEFVEPHGAFYFFFRVDGFPDPSVERAIGPGGEAKAAVMSGQRFCFRLLEEEGVSLVPGDAFGDDRWVRLSFAAADDDLHRALDRVFAYCHRLGGAAVS